MLPLSLMSKAKSTDGIKMLVVGGVILVSVLMLVFYINGLKSDIEDLENDKEVLVGKNAILKAEKERSLSKIERQNNELDKFRADNEAIKKELQKWENKPIEVKYKTKYVRKIVTDLKEDTKSKTKAEKWDKMEELLERVRNIDVSKDL